MRESKHPDTSKKLVLIDEPIPSDKTCKNTKKGEFTAAKPTIDTSTSTYGLNKSPNHQTTSLQQKSNNCIEKRWVKILEEGGSKLNKEYPMVDSSYWTAAIGYYNKKYSEETIIGNISYDRGEKKYTSIKIKHPVTLLTK